MADADEMRERAIAVADEVRCKIRDDFDARYGIGKHRKCTVCGHEYSLTWSQVGDPCCDEYGHPGPCPGVVAEAGYTRPSRG